MNYLFHRVSIGTDDAKATFLTKFVLESSCFIMLFVLIYNGLIVVIFKQIKNKHILNSLVFIFNTVNMSGVLRQKSLRTSGLMKEMIKVTEYIRLSKGNNEKRVEKRKQ